LIPGAAADHPECRRHVGGAAPLATPTIEPDITLPSHLLRRALGTPDKRLLLAVLEEAVGTHQRYIVATDRRGIAILADVEAWFASDDEARLSGRASRRRPSRHPGPSSRPFAPTPAGARRGCHRASPSSSTFSFSATPSPAPASRTTA
jgi:hypothetical protein